MENVKLETNVLGTVITRDKLVKEETRIKDLKNGTKEITVKLIVKK